MGFFSYAYIIEGEITDSGIELLITGYSMGGATLFSWGQGTRPRGMNSLANNTLYCKNHVQTLSGYPRVDRREEDINKDGLFYIEESFFPRSYNEPVLFHVVLPPRFVIRPDQTPFTLTKEANIRVVDDRLIFTLPAVGGADLRFWISRMEENENFENYDLNRLITASKADPLKIRFELNLGVVKIKFG